VKRRESHDPCSVSVLGNHHTIGLWLSSDEKIALSSPR
jgi:hypothetical protein